MSNQSVSTLYATQCAAEPIHLLGAVQPHGYVMVVSLDTGLIVQVSSGISRHNNDRVSAADVLGKPLSKWVKHSKDQVLDVLAALAPDKLHDIRLSRRASLRADDEEPWLENAECTAYRVGQYVVIEWIPFPIETPATLQRAFDTATFTQVLTHESHEQDTLSYLRGVATRLQAASGYQRVMIYQFLPDWSGEIIAEATREDTPVAYEGLRFPATDIPPQARALYLKNRLRVLADVDATPDLLIPATLPDDEPLDQSLGLLRAMSQAHLVYLKNMKVSATLTVSIIIDGVLWGMIACHHDSPLVPPHYVVSMMRSAALALSSVISMRLNDLSRLSKIESEQQIVKALDDLRDVLLQSKSLEEGLLQLASDVAPSFHASHLGLSLNGRLVTSMTDGALSSAKLGHALERVIQNMSPREIRSWSHLPDDIAQLPWPEGTSGFLIARLEGDSTRDYFFITRQDSIRVVNWAGAPGKFVTVDGDTNGEVRLEPRRSFALWQETQRGKCDPWSGQDEYLASKLLVGLSEIASSWREKQLQQRLAWQATHDSLTGLLNREGLQSMMVSLMKASSTVLCIIDINQFQLINGATGHAVGDALLQEVGVRLLSVARDRERVARIGDDEFALIASVPSDDESEAERIVSRIKQQFEHPVIVMDRHFNLALSIGVAFTNTNAGDQNSLIKRAGIALAEAKRQHRERFVVFSHDMEASLAHEMALVREFRHAIKHDELVLHYQPKLCLRRLQIVGFEALIRWQHPEKGLMMPGYFLPVIEGTALIQEMGKWVIKTAIRQLTEWNNHVHPKLSLAINLSFSEIQNDDVIAYLREKLLVPSLMLHQFQIELTESTVLSDHTRGINVSQWLREQGVSVALDDFGTGYSSLSHLLGFNFDYLKIDRSFIKDVDTNLHSQRIVSSLLELAKGVGACVVAEGIEREAQAQWLLQRDCQQVQGFLYSRAVPAHDIKHLIKQWGVVGDSQ